MICVRFSASRVALLLACLAVASPVSALAPPAPLPDWAKMKKPVQKKALVVGISNYVAATPLTSPKADAEKIASTLTKVAPDFSARLVPPDRTDRRALLEEFKNFAATLQPGDVALVFYSGHGVERDNVNYLVPADAILPKPGLEGLQYIPIDYVSNLLREARAGSVVLVLDACRTDPFSGTGASEPLLKPVASLAQRPAQGLSTEGVSVAIPTSSAAGGLGDRLVPAGVIVAYSAASRMPSYSRFEDEPETVPSIYTRRLASIAETLNKPLDQIFSVTSAQVSELTKNWQTPFVSSYSGGQILLQKNENLAQEEEETWARVANSPSADLRLNLASFVTLYPSSVYADAARRMIAELDRGTANPASDAALASSPMQTDAVVFSGALKSASIQSTQRSIAIAQRDVFVRATPSQDTPKIAVVPQGTSVQVLGQSEKQGWAKILLSGGKVGYVGSVGAAPVESAKPSDIIQVIGSDLVAAVQTLNDRWKSFAAKSTLAIRVNPKAGANPWVEDRDAFLTALRLRDSALETGVKPANVMIFLGPATDSVGAASLTLVREGKL